MGLSAKRKKELKEELEIIDTIGQESDSKAVPHVIEAAKINEVKEKLKEEERLNRLDSHRLYPMEYKEELLKYLHEMLNELSFPKKWQWGCWFDGLGVRVSVVNPSDKLFSRAFRPVYDPKFDLHACYKFTRWAEDLLDMHEGTQESRIWTPPTHKAN